ncbi:hypothetical protein Aple_091960 [Acrocarpospora pleiomorpha]|uniref:Protein kinase domain-containing protein n=1 Tax=Acrocarpospora pleiomorpha TaxID=90975 RepID=A0A5M3XYT3_9ACTN|nr:hypothetical protein [Acrocarpospora pleiomorpha]GES26297.1 hypothetical protein Aple_091960 [Acrocarpospora pleiomorpha]
MADQFGTQLDYTDAEGTQRQGKLIHQGPGRIKPGSELVISEIQVEVDGVTGWLVKKSLHQAAAKHDPQLYARMENEVRTGLMLRRRFGGPAYPAELARLAGYDVDCEEPFVLYERLQGSGLAADVAGRLLLEEQKQFQITLLRGVRILEQVGIVHRGITPYSVWWDGHVAQLTDFELAIKAQRWRTPVGERPWASPQQRHGVGGTCARDDVWSAGMVIYHVAAGTRSTAALNGPLSLNAVEPRTRELLAGVFADKAKNRPHPLDLLIRLRETDPIAPPEEAADGAFERGGLRYDEMMRQKWGSTWRRPPVARDPMVEDDDEDEVAPPPAPSPPEYHAPPSAPVVRVGGGGMVLAVVVAVVVLAIALWLIGGML